MSEGTPTRTAIRDHVAEHPGVHFNAIVRGLDLAPGQVQYHVRRLRSRGAIEREEFYGRTHYYPPAYDEWERGAIALLRRETARDVVAVLLTEGPTPPAAVAEEVDVARSTLEHHLDHLVERDVVEKRRDGRGRVTLALVDPDRTLELLETVAPSLPSSMVDRFTRLVDRLLAE